MKHKTQNIKRRTWNIEPRGKSALCSMFYGQCPAGFTIIETLAAISILMIAVAGPLTLANRSLSSSIYAKEQLTASLLAQDAAEYIVAARSLNFGNQDTTWLGSLSGCVPTNPCGLDTRKSFDGGDSSGLKRCVAVDNEDCRLTFNPNNSTYGYDALLSGTGIVNSIYTRTIALAEIDEREAKIVITVSWNQGITPRSIVLRTSLFNLFGVI